MKMRLIDADELKNILTVAEYPCVLQNALIEIIDMQPTAYNVDNVLERLKKASYERFGNTGMGGELVVNLDDAIKVIRTRELNCDETQEIRTVLKHMHEILDEAIETNACGNENELSRMVEAYLPNIEQSYKYFIERMMGVKHE
jgi:hypothetical protein|nr:MAG TPA: hypothetical protein [Caudoviricetes sp.]